MLELIQAGPPAWARVDARSRAGDAASFPLRSVRLLAPLPNPPKIVAIGLNYMDHCREQNVPVPDRPLVFAKFTSSIIGPGDDIVWDPALTQQVDYEAELGVVIGRRARRVSVEQALDCVFGYTIVNDVSARDWVAPIFSATGIMGPIHAWEHNILGKLFPTFCPMGPVLATKDEVPDPENVKLQTRLNGKVMQDANTDDLVFSVVQLIEYYSQFYLFKPGDVITTGSPSGVGYGRNPKVFMKAGDVVEVEVSGIGILRNPVVAPR